ncbi:hypothetical protein MNEG_11956, partial [Monoraphidium neglectum]
MRRMARAFDREWRALLAGAASGGMWARDLRPLRRLAGDIEEEAAAWRRLVSSRQRRLARRLRRWRRGYGGGRAAARDDEEAAALPEAAAALHELRARTAAVGAELSATARRLRDAGGAAPAVGSAGWLPAVGPLLDALASFAARSRDLQHRAERAAGLLPPPPPPPPAPLPPQPPPQPAASPRAGGGGMPGGVGRLLVDLPGGGPSVTSPRSLSMPASTLSAQLPDRPAGILRQPSVKAAAAAALSGLAAAPESGAAGRVHARLDSLTQRAS